MMFIPAWWAAKALVPSRAMIIAKERKPIRRKICSTRVLELTFQMEARVALSKRKRRRKFRWRKPSGWETE